MIRPKQSVAALPSLHATTTPVPAITTTTMRLRNNKEILPKQQQQQHHKSFFTLYSNSNNHTFTTIWVIVQLCSTLCILQILATSVPLVNCDKHMSTYANEEGTATRILSESSSSSSNNNDLKNSDKLLHRVARLTQTLDPNSIRNVGKLSYGFNNTAGYMASYGLRTLKVPQRFYTKQLRSAWSGGATTTTTIGNELTSLNQVKDTAARLDICKDCTCDRKNSFIAVTCDFQKNPNLSPVFDSKYKVPSHATSININLAAKTRFQLNSGFFEQNHVNSLSINGNMAEGQQIELNQYAFVGNAGPYPEMNFTNVFSIIIKSKAFTGSGKLNIYNSNDVIIYEQAFENSQINGVIVGIKDFRLLEGAFKSGQAVLRIESSHIDNLYRFEASLREIKFIDCSIGTINAGTFDVTEIKHIIFESCRIDAIKARAFTNKFLGQKVYINNGSIGFIESDAIYHSGISALRITNNKIDTIYENAISVTSINVTIAGNNVKHLANNWLHVKDWTNVVVEKNQFGTFGRIALEPSTKKSKSCLFSRNSLTKPEKGSLNFTNPYCTINDISVNIPCRCNLDWLDSLSEHDLRSHIYCTIEGHLGNCFNASTFNTLKYLNEVCAEEKTTLDCIANMNLKKVDGKFFTAEELEQKNQRLPKLIMILSASILLLVLITSIVIVLICRFRKRTSKLGRSNSQGHSHIHEFSQQERMVIDQTLQLIQKKYPEIYKKTHKCIQYMISPDLSEEKCIKTTSQIVNLLNKVQNPGADFMAFNRVLTGHLQSPLPTAPPSGDQAPIYSEPGMQGMEGDFYTTPTFAHVEAGLGVASMAAGPEHIYAEPSCAQQPLLPNEYASPADRHLASMDVYTEPISERDSNLTTPYAVASATPRTYQSPYRPTQYSTPLRSYQHQHGRPLPDVLSQQSSSSAIQSNVQKLAQDLQRRTNFNPIAKPRNMHLVTPPTYTAPDIRHKQQHLTKPNSNLVSASSQDEIEMDMRGATALPPRPAQDSNSNHSGGSNETVKIDDVIEYADS